MIYINLKFNDASNNITASGTGSFGMIKVDDNKPSYKFNADKLDGQDGSYYLDFGNFVIDNDKNTNLTLHQMQSHNWRGWFNDLRWNSILGQIY